MAPNSATHQPWSLKMTVPLEPGIVCNNIEAMLEFYTGVLGLKLVGDAPRVSDRPIADAVWGADQAGPAEPGPASAAGRSEMGP